MGDVETITSTSTPVTKTVKHVKLRESCDSCLAAKVKCGKEKPLCRRCLVNGSPCAYSPSLKTGRKSQHTSSRATPHDRIQVAAPASTAPASGDGVFDHSRAAFGTAKMTDLLNDAQDFFAKESSEFVGNQTNLQEGSSSLIFDLPGPENTANSPGQLFEGSFEPLKYLDPFLPYFRTENALDSPVPSVQQVHASTKNRGFFDSRPSASPFPGPRSLSQMTAPFVHTPPSSDSSTHGFPDSPCDCFSTCVEVLQTLHIHSSLLSNTQQEGGPSFDVVLKSNADALESCNRVLNCTQCVSEYGVMMLATIIGKVISIYRTACSLMFSAPDNRESKAQMAFGTYKLSSESRQVLEMELLFLDLRRVTGTLIGFAQRFCAHPQDQTNENGISDVLRTHLENDLGDLVKVIQGAKEQRGEKNL